MFEVIVGNVGTVYRGNDERVAWGVYHDYIDQSLTNPGNRCYGEPVTILEDNEIHAEYLGKESQ